MIHKWVADHFALVQLIILTLVILVGWNSLRSRQQQSAFRNREAERPDLDQLNRMEPKKKSTSAPLSLPGITLNGKPHEILGVPVDANESEILRAYKEKIKLYHPDRIQGQARTQIQFYEDASAKINQAKESMIENLRRK